MTTETQNATLAEVARRWQSVDPLLPEPELGPGCGAVLRTSSAAGFCEHWAGEPGSLNLAWGAARRFQLSPYAAGPDAGASLDELIAVWRQHLAEVPGTGQPDTAAIIDWPSRDADGVQTLLRRGFAPLATIAARTAGRSPDGPAGRSAAAAARAGVRIRRAGPADLDSLVNLAIGLIRYDALFGSVIERPDTIDALRREAAPWLAQPEPWIWLAERSGAPAGLLVAQRPDAASWIAPMTKAGPVAYLMMGFVQPELRTGGVGAELAAHYHREADAAGIGVTLLHYATLNPLSAPFWSRQGYRPLWTSYEVSPANGIR
jgi:GNAT superfamily N-acetyltransferase